MEYENIRNYEVSIWTLQDSFITVLKYSNLENKGQIEEGIIKLNIDGTQELSFRIPMYLEDGLENPNWHNTRNGNLIANMRKIKVIFNKALEGEKVFEFLITKVEDSHEEDQLYCYVECEGLAFHELGKQGYRISLSSKDYEIAVAEAEEKGESAPLNNIQFWLNDLFKKYTDSSNLLHEWRYIIQIEQISQELDNDKIYEDAYETSWGIEEEGKLVAKEIQEAHEKCRNIDIEESNYYNITQKLAEIFGVYCKYVYEYDDNYHIIDKKIIFYNNFYAEKDGYIDFTYPNSAELIKRVNDSTDLVTKLYVKNITDNNTASGLISIMDTEVNPSKEDYLLNFDYLHEVGTISDEQYESIDKFEAEMHRINTELIPIDSQLAVLNDNLVTAKANLQMAKTSRALAEARIEDSNKLFESLTGGDGTIEITANNPATGILLQDSQNTSEDKENYYYLKITTQGINVNTLHIYRKYDYTAVDNDSPLTEEINGWSPQYDDSGNLIRINNIYATTQDSKIVYLIYNYSPRLYYENVKKVWEIRLAKDQKTIDELENQISEIEDNITALKESQQMLLEEKKQLISNFNIEMGPALREGYWAPENYIDYGNRFIDSIQLNTSGQEISGTTPDLSFIWDEKPFDGEQLGSYSKGIEDQKLCYPAIDLSRHLLDISNHLDDLNFLFYDYNISQGETYEPNRLRSLPLGSLCQLAFMKKEENEQVSIIPVLLITDESLIPSGGDDGPEEDVILNFMKSTGFLGRLTTSIVGQEGNKKIETSYETYVEGPLNWTTITLVGEELLQDWTTYPLVYPRIKINSLNLKTSSDQLNVKYNSKQLNNYENYTVLARYDSEDEGYYITLKPEAIIKEASLTRKINISYSLSNAADSIYLDAVQVARENAYPKVSYEIDPNIYGENFMRYAYDMLGVLAHINDVDLKFENVMGYISEIELNLDKPWEDTIEIKNYKNKFEDLFSTIVAQTEAMKNAEPILNSAGNIIAIDGTLKGQAVQDVIRHVDLDYAFNNGNLTIDNANGIWGTSDSGVVAFRGGGIFTATEKNDDGDWKWNTGITPEGINADLITTGQLDTNRIKVYAGDKLRFQLNGDGLFAYKSFTDDRAAIAKIQERVDELKEQQVLTEEQQEELEKKENLLNDINANNGLDKKQYVKLEENGLFLIAENGAWIKDKNNSLKEISSDYPIQRVSISWDGLTLKNYDNEKVFYADADTGDLTVKGEIKATALTIVNNEEEVSIDDYLDDYVPTIIADDSTIKNLQQQIDGEIDTWFYVGAPAPLTLDAASKWLPPVLEQEWGLTTEHTESGYSPADLEIILRHTSDIYYDIGTPSQSVTAGQTYRFIAQKDNNNVTYYWLEISDTATTAALSAASKAQETADGKIKTYYATEISDINISPNIIDISPNEGDLWINISRENSIYRYSGSTWIIINTPPDVEYAFSNSPDTAPSSGWNSSYTTSDTTDIYIWTRTKYISNGIIEYTNPVCIGTNNEIDKIIEQYIQSARDDQKPLSTNPNWKDYCPEWDEKQPYYWTRNLIVWKNSNSTPTEAVLATGINFANIETNQLKQNVDNMIRLESGVITIGPKTAGENDFKTRLDNKELSFYQGKQRVAYISNEQLSITKAKITNEIIMAETENLGYWRWRRVGGGLALQWTSTISN